MVLDVAGARAARATIAVAIDPAGSAEGDETDILAAGIDEAGDGWVLADESGHSATVGRRAMIYHRLHADRVVAETNFGGGMVEATLRAADRSVSFRAVTASRGKVARAEPVSALYKEGRGRSHWRSGHSDWLIRHHMAKVSG